MEKLNLSDSTYFHVVPRLTLQLNSVQRPSPRNLQMNQNKSNRQFSHKKSQEKQIFKHMKDFSFNSPPNKQRSVSRVVNLNSLDYQGPLTQRVQNNIHQNRVPKFISKKSKQMQYRSWINHDYSRKSLKYNENKENTVGNFYQKKYYQQEKSITSQKSQRKLQQNSPISKTQDNQNLSQKRFSQDQFRAIYSKVNQLFRQNQILKSEKLMLQSKVQSIQRFHQQQIAALRRRIKTLEETTDDIQHFMINQMI